MNDTYINYIDQLLDLAERNDIFCLTSRAFNEFAVEVRAALEKGKPMRPKVDGEFGLCKRCGYVFNSELISEYCVKYCPNCGQKLDWED